MVFFTETFPEIKELSQNAAAQTADKLGLPQENKTKLLYNV